MAVRAFSRSKVPTFASGLLRAARGPTFEAPAHAVKRSEVAASEIGSSGKALGGWFSRVRAYHDGRPRGPLWRGKKLIGKEALFVIIGLKRFKDDQEKLDKFMKNHVRRLLKMEMVAVLIELERQQEVDLALKIFNLIRKQDWYKPDKYLYKDLIVSLARSKKMDDVMMLWEHMKEDELFPDSQTYSEVIKGFLSFGSPGDAMNIYEDMKNSPDPPEELPFRILLKGLLPHPLLRNRVKQDFEELFPEKHMYDPPEEIFGAL